MYNIILVQTFGQFAKKSTLSSSGKVVKTSKTGLVGDWFAHLDHKNGLGNQPLWADLDLHGLCDFLLKIWVDFLLYGAE